MVYRRRSYRKRYYRRKSTPAKFRRWSRRPRKINKYKQSVQYFTRYCKLDNLSYTNTTGIPVNLSTLTDNIYWKLSQLTNATDFVTLYDQYKILGIKISFIPHANVTFGNGQISAFSNRLLTCYDPNDTGLVSSNTIRQYSSCKVTPINVIHTRFFKPKPLAEYANTTAGGTVLAVPTSNPWFDVQSNRDVQYHGMKVAIDLSTPYTIANGDSVTFFAVECKFYLAMRGKQ